MNFTWFASSYDTDDVPYRLLTMVQMAGVLVLAAGVPAAFEDGDFRAVSSGYLIMRIGLVAQWLRAGVEDPAGRRDGAALRRRASPSSQVGLAAAAVPRRGRRAAARRRLLPVFVCSRRPRARGAAVGGADAVDQLAPAPHRRALRPVHDHPARRERARRVDRGRRRRSRPAGVGAAFVDRSRSAGWCCCSRSGGCTSSSRAATGWPTAATGPTCGATATTASSRRWRRSAPGLEVAVEQTGHHVEVSAVAVGYAVAVPVGGVPGAAVGGATRRSCRGRSSGPR